MKNEFITCKICERPFKSVASHLRAHKILATDYRNTFKIPYGCLQTEDFKREIGWRISKGKTKEIPKSLRFSFFNLENSYLLGLLWSDGHIAESGISITSSEKGLMDFLCKTFGGKYFKHNDRNAYRWNFNSISLKKMLLKRFDKFGLKPNKSASLRMPLTEPIIWFAFVQGLIDGDGCFCCIKGRLEYFDYSSKSHKLLDDLNRLLVLAGVTPRLRKILKNGECFSLRLYGAEAWAMGHFVFLRPIFKSRKYYKFQDYLEGKHYG